MSHTSETQFWFVALVGRPNSGKSTFLNTLLDEKVSIVSARPQTTQRTILGIYTDSKVQIAFLDTPGLLDGEAYLETRIHEEIFASLQKSDLILRFLDPTRPYGEEERKIDQVLSTISRPILRVSTKSDRPARFPVPHSDISISSVTRDGFSELLTQIQKFLPLWPHQYDESYYTLQEKDFRISECIREALFLHLDEEIPYACYVNVEEIEDMPELMKILAYVSSETESQKKILIGRGGAKIQEIGKHARLLLESIFWKKVHLLLRVKVAKNWRKDPRTLDSLFL